MNRNAFDARLLVFCIAVRKFVLELAPAMVPHASVLRSPGCSKSGDEMFPRWGFVLCAAMLATACGGGGGGGSAPPAPHTTPDPFSFTAQPGVQPSTQVTSNAATITGITAAAQSSITGGEYSIGCTGTFTSSAGTINNGQTVCVRQTSSASFNTTTTAALTVGGVTGSFNVTTRAPNTTPNAFAFTSQTNVQPSTSVTSNAVTMTGLEAPASISVSSGLYSIGCTGTFTASAGTINNNQSVCVQQTSSASFSTTTLSTLTIGGASATFSVTTRAPNTTPNAFSFTSQTGVQPSTLVTSNAATITGLEAPASVTVSGGQYSINCTGTFTSSAGSISNNQTVCLQQMSSGSGDTTTTATVTIGGVAGTFSVTTALAALIWDQGNWDQTKWQN